MHILGTAWLRAVIMMSPWYMYNCISYKPWPLRSTSQTYDSIPQLLEVYHLKTPKIFSTFRLGHSHGLYAMYVLEVYRYIGSAKYWLPIWQNFQYRQLVLFEIVPIFLPIFYTSTNGLILLMHCLVVTTFTVLIITILLLLTMVYNEFYYIICAIHEKNSLLCITDQLLVSVSF